MDKWMLMGKIIKWFYNNDLCDCCETYIAQYHVLRDLAKIIEEAEE